jgi:endonuclease/exonuclease/phosphatase family metal-dependent hydrolase
MALKIYVANLQHGTYTDGSFNYAGQAAILSAGDIDIVAANEVSVGDLGSWDTGFTAGGMSREIYHPAFTGAGDGNAIWVRDSTITVIQNYTFELTTGVNPTSGQNNIGWDGSTDVRRSAAAIKAEKDGKQFYFVVTHLCHSRCADSSGSEFSQQRVSQINSLVSQIQATFTDGLPIIIAGDFNLDPDWPKSPSGLQLDGFFDAGFVDVWVEAIADGTATANWGDRDSSGSPDMPIGSLTTITAFGRRIDYFLFKDGTPSMSIAGMDIPDLREECSGALVPGGNVPHCPDVEEDQRTDTPFDFGVMPADHAWQIATFNLTASIVLCKWSTAPACQ